MIRYNLQHVYREEEEILIPFEGEASHVLVITVLAYRLDTPKESDIIMSFKPQRFFSPSSLDSFKKENSRHTRTQVPHHQHTCGYCEIRESLLTHLLYCYTPPQYIHVLSLSCLKWAEHGIRQCTIFVFLLFHPLRTCRHTDNK